MEITIEPSTIDDRDFAFRVTEEAMRTYVEQAFGSWDRDAQKRRSHEAFDPATCSLVVVDRERAGILVVEDRPLEIFLLKIFLLPRFQRQGIGSIVIGRLLERDRVVAKPLRLRVLHVNPARALYQRLGFVETSDTADHVYMEYAPADGDLTADEGDG